MQKATTIVKLSSKGQLVVPKEFRARMGLTSGDILAVHEISDNLLVLEKLPASSIADVTDDLRREARRKGFGARQLAAAIKKARREIYAETYR